MVIYQKFNMTAINNIKISSNNDAIDGLKSTKNDSGFKNIFNSLEISDLTAKEDSKNIENDSKAKRIKIIQKKKTQ